MYTCVYIHICICMYVHFSPARDSFLGLAAGLGRSLAGARPLSLKTRGAWSKLASSSQEVVEIHVKLRHVECRVVEEEGRGDLHHRPPSFPKRCSRCRPWGVSFEGCGVEVKDVKVCKDGRRRVAAQNHLVHVARGTSQERPVVVEGLDEWIQADG